VARASYIDPRVIELYQDGRTIAGALGELGKDSDFGDLATKGRAEKAVLNLLKATGPTVAAAPAARRHGD
jgi:DNA topoisomerase-1